MAVGYSIGYSVLYYGRALSYYGKCLNVDVVVNRYYINRTEVKKMSYCEPTNRKLCVKL